MIFFNFRELGEVTSEMVCGLPENDTETCVYNSGGPITANKMLIGRSQGRLAFITDSFLSGLHSWGRWCGNPKFPGVYTKISDARPWFNKHLKEDIDDNCWRVTPYKDRAKYYLRRVVKKLNPFCSLKLNKTDLHRSIGMACSFPKVFKWFG